MNQREQESLEQRARSLFQNSVESLDMPTRSRLTRARHAALEAATARQSWRVRKVWWMPAAGLSAAAVLGAVLWMGTPMGTPSFSSLLGHHAVSLGDAQSNLEDLDIVAAADDPLDMLQDDPDFYDFADKAANSEPAA